MNLLYLIFIFLFFMCVGEILLRALKIRETEYLLQITLGLIAASYLTFCLAGCARLDRNPVIGLMAVVIAIRIKILSELLRSLGRNIRSLISNLSASEKIFFLILIFQAGINFFLTLTPPTGWDSLAYHLAIPKLILGEGKMIEPVSYGGVRYPLFMEMLYTLCLLIKGAGLAKLLAWGIGILTVWAIYELASSIGHRDIGIVGGAIFYGTQVVSMWAGECYVDIPLAFFAVMAVLSVVKFSKKKEFKRWLLVALLIAVLPGIKYNGIFLAFIVGLYAISQLLAQPNSWRRSLLGWAMVVFLAMVVILNSQWYLFQNQGREIEKVSLTANTILPNAARPNLLKPYLDKLFFVFWRLTLFYDRDGRISPVFLAFIPLLIFLKPPKEIKIWLTVSLSYVVVFSFLGFLHSRYILPVLPLLGIISAYSYEEIIKKGKILGYLLGVILIFTFLFNIGLTLYNHQPELKLLGKKVGERDYLEARVSVYPVINYINKNIKDGKILLIGESRGYYLERPFLWGHVLRGLRAEELKGFLAQNKITHLLVNEQIVYEKKPDEEMREILNNLSAQMALIYRRDYFKVYRIL